MKFKLLSKNKIRRGEIETAHGKILTPFFMPVGTVGSVKGVSPEELKNLGTQIVLANTYHLYLRPGEKVIKKLGGLHRFIGWDRPILTDSGGYQVFSLGKNKSEIQNPKSEKNDNKLISYKLQAKNSLVKIMDDGVEFTSHLDGSKHLFTPEKVIQIQLDLGVDILMPLDYCPSGKASSEEIKRSVDITISWAKRSKRYFDRKITNRKSSASASPMRDGQIANKFQTLNIKKKANKLRSYKLKPEASALFGIVQGGLDQRLRNYCAEELIKLNFDGYAVGGLAVDYETRNMWETVKQMGETLPVEKPRYLMGVGTPDDIIKAVGLGMDMFDCVLPTRLARHGSVYLKPQTSNLKLNRKYILLNLLNSQYRTDGDVIDKNCQCPACKLGKGFSRAYISHLIREKEMLGMRLATLHNLYQYLDLVKN